MAADIFVLFSELKLPTAMYTYIHIYVVIYMYIKMCVCMSIHLILKGVALLNGKDSLCYFWVGNALIKYHNDCFLTPWMPHASHIEHKPEVETPLSSI